MKIAIIGFGRMGKAIDRLSGPEDEVVLKIGKYNTSDLTKEALSNCDVAIEFSIPSAAFENIKFCLEAGIPVISGTTGWLDKKEEIESICKKHDGTFFYASNFSINNHNGHQDWKLNPSDKKEGLAITAIREGEVPGTHEVNYKSEMDKISIRHEAFTRDSFAQGALIAANWVIGKKGILTMSDLMNIT